MKKIIGLLLAASLTISLLSGCTKQNENPVVEETKGTETETENQQPPALK